MRLIDADKAMERERMTGNCRTCNHYIASLKECGGGAEGEAVCQFLRSAFDTVDAVPVVRCKDCEYYTEEERWCRRLGLCGAFDPNGYCSHAERSEDGET